MAVVKMVVLEVVMARGWGVRGRRSLKLVKRGRGGDLCLLIGARGGVSLGSGSVFEMSFCRAGELLASLFLLLFFPLTFRSRWKILFGGIEYTAVSNTRLTA